MTWSEAAPPICNAISLIVTYVMTRKQHIGTQSKVETESSKIQLGVSQSEERVKTDVVEAVKSRAVSTSVDYGDRLTAIERKQDLIIENMRRKPGTPWIDEITRVTEPKGK